MSEIKQSSVASLRSGSYVVIEGVACKVNKIETSRPGKHGHAKCRVDASSLLDGNRKVIVLPGHDKIDVPIIDKKLAQVLSINGNVANVMDEENYETFDLKIPEDLKDKVVEGVSVIFWNVLGEKILKEIKNG
jgi:translation initiation factor 5A